MANFIDFHSKFTVLGRTYESLKKWLSDLTVSARPNRGFYEFQPPEKSNPFYPIFISSSVPKMPLNFSGFLQAQISLDTLWINL
jgi:hypothetical protein